MSVNKKQSQRQHRNIEKVTSLWNVRKKIDDFSHKLFLKNNNEANKQEQNISLNPKQNLPDALHGKNLNAKQWLKIQFFTT